ncbi:hypothetical protein KEJ32_04100 [Candidatus Bathyarchaeota archaeon]|nr:hypothetical protein [Candidatus Bathyarchaeota archaeon]
MWVISNTFVGAAVSLGFASYLCALFPALPPNIAAAVFCFLFTALNFLRVIYILVGFVALGACRRLKAWSFRLSPLAEAMGVAGNTLAVYTVSVGGLIATASVLLTAILGVSRMAYATARRKIYPKP